MKKEQRKQAEIYAARLASIYGLESWFVESVAKGKLHYSVAMWEQQAGVMVEIDRNRSTFGLHVKELEKAEGVLVYHCILAGPFLTFLYVPNRSEKWDTVGPVIGSDEVHAYAIETNELWWGQGIITLGSYDGVLIRIN